jgi:CheY-like chemotaxis protein
VLLAPDGASAVEAFRQREGEIHAVLLYLVMPGMDGAEAFRELRKLRPRVAVVLMTGHNEAEVVRGLQEQGLSGFLRKPFRPHQLVAALEQALVA